jgi:branched-chain amino acid transport system substrate-binding protein
MEKYGSEPDLFAAQGYSSVYLLLDAVKRAGSVDHAVLRDALAATKDLSTPLGGLTMSPIREVEHAPVAQRFEGGKLVVLP